MAGIGIIEILDHFGRVRERVPIHSLPAIIGRAYDCDIIIDDPYICPHHLEITQAESGELMLRDMDSVNGSSYISDTVISDLPYPVKHDRKIKIGHTQIRFRKTDHPVKATRVDRVRVNIIGELLTSRIFTIVCLLGIIGYLYLSNYLSSYYEFKIGKQFFSEVLPVLIMLLVWAGVWSVISKITMHYFFYNTHITIAALATVAGLLASVFHSYTDFAFSTQFTFRIQEYLTTLVILSLMLYGHLRFCTQTKTRKLAIIASSIAGLIVGLSFASEYINNRDYGSYSEINNTVKSPRFQLSSSIPLDELLQHTHDLKQRIDNEIRESAREEEEIE